MIATLRHQLAMPVLARDARARMRRRRTAWLLAGCLAVAVVAGLAAYAASPRAAGDPAVVTGAATALFRAAAAATLMLVALLGVALGAGSISGEAERGNLDLLRAGAVPAWRLVVGKALEVVLLLGLITLAPLPLYAMAAYLGGLDAATLAGVLLGCLATALLTTALGVLCSTLAPSTAAATALAAGGLLMAGGLPLMLGVVVPQGAAAAPECPALLCPASSPATARILGAAPSPLTATVPLLVVQPGGDSPGTDWWHLALPVEGGEAAVLLGLASVAVERRRWPS